MPIKFKISFEFVGVQIEARRMDGGDRPFCILSIQ